MADYDKKKLSYYNYGGMNTLFDYINHSQLLISFYAHALLAHLYLQDYCLFFSSFSSPAKHRMRHNVLMTIGEMSALVSVNQPETMEITDPVFNLNVESPSMAFAMLVNEQTVEPRNYREAITGHEAENWKQAISEELAAHEKNGTWLAVPRPHWKILMTTKWVFKIKRRTDGSIERFKARFSWF